MSKIIPTLTEEQKLWHKSSILIGTDEAGRGPLAGPVVAAAMALLPPNQKSKIKSQKSMSSTSQNDFKDLIGLGINDSKKLTPKKREDIFNALISHPDIVCAIGVVHEKAIDKLNILQASLLAMRKATSQVTKKCRQKGFSNYIIYVDGREVIPLLIVDQKSIINGDQKIFSIAAASVIAKVTRDKMMLQYAEKYPQYGFEKHKGYGTKLHFEMIRKYGPCLIHRQSFLKK